MAITPIINGVGDGDHAVGSSRDVTCNTHAMAVARPLHGKYCIVPDRGG